ncbi:hypothetical protein [Vibrio owensii]|uniref:hypothetical protein n=1 Tax=Vibrio harveyi group TaxID=717610 RepID=UPI003CC6C09F
MKTFGTQGLTNPKINLYDEVRLSRESFLKNAQPDPDEFTFKLSKYQGDCERGTDGLVQLLGTKSAIDDTIKHMLKEYPEWTKDLLKTYEPSVNAIKDLTEDELTEDGFRREFFNHSFQFDGKSIKDGVEMDETSLSLSFLDSPDSGIEQENIRFHVTKWQGDGENGKLGFLSLLTIKEQIEKSLKWTAQQFPDLTKDAQKEFSSLLDKSNEESLSM